MASRTVQTPPTSRIPLVYVAAGLLLFAAALGASLGFGATTRVEVDGAVRHVPEGTTIGRLAVEGHLAGSDGDILSVSGSRVVRHGGGAPLKVWRNGRPATLGTTVFDGDVIRSAPGADVVEATVEETRPIEVDTRIEGKGPLMTLVSPGSVGVMRVKLGAASRSVVASTVVVPASPMIVERHGALPGEKLVALTFDDGPWPGQTDAILNILRDQGVKGTFFMLGYLARRSPGLAKRVADEGHLVGNHTMGHKMLTRLALKDVDKQIASGQSVIGKASGATPTWFRPPGGAISPDVWTRVRAADLRVAMWDIDPQDWRKPSVSVLTQRVVKRVKPGSIVLLHDGGGDRSATVTALPWIITKLKAQGYRFVTLDELAGS